jgi:hypothetical protein
MPPNAPVDESSTSDVDPGVEPTEGGVEIRSPADDEDVPARRLLAHDLEHLVWDQDGEAPVPPPD